MKRLLAPCLASMLIISSQFMPQVAQGAMKAGKFSACYYYGTFLAGKVQVVTTSLGRPTDRIPTFKIQRTTSFPDLKVQEVSSFPTQCGKWKYVTSFPDFKVRFVTSFPDFKVQFVSSFPGLR